MKTETTGISRTALKPTKTEEIFTYPDRERDFDRERGGDLDLDRDLPGERREDLGLGDLLQLRFRVSR